MGADLPGRGAPVARWSPVPAIRASFVLHGAAAAGAVASPEHWPWALGAVAANHLALVVAACVPRGTVVGANLCRLPPESAARGEIALTFDDGPDPELTPRVLDLLARHRARATFFCIGSRVHRHPAIARRIVDEGHAIGNHSHRHATTFACRGLKAIAREVDAAQAAIADATGAAPRWFRAPFGVRSPLLDPVLAVRGLRHVAWSARAFDTGPRDPAAALARLLRGTVPGAVLLLHDGRATGGRPGQIPSVAPQLLPALLERLAGRGLRAVALHDAFAPAPGVRPVAPAGAGAR